MKDSKLNYNVKLIEYVIKNLRKGYTKESLRWALINQGHSRIEVEKALKKADEDLAREAPILRTKPEMDYETIEPKTQMPQVKRSFWDKLLGR